MEKQAAGSQSAKPRTYTDEYRRQVVDMMDPGQVHAHDPVQGRKRRRVALAGHDHADEAQAGGAGDVRHDMVRHAPSRDVQLQVHVHALDVRGRIVRQPLALAQGVPQRRDPALQTEARPQQPMLVRSLQPLGVGSVVVRVAVDTACP